MGNAIDLPVDDSTQDSAIQRGGLVSAEGTDRGSRDGAPDGGTRGTPHDPASTVGSGAGCAPPRHDLRRPRILLIVEGCNPQLTSVPLVGFFHSEALRQVADVLVVTPKRNRSALAGVGWKEGKDFVCIHTERLSRWAWKISTFLAGGTGVGWTLHAAAAVPLYYLFEQRLWERLGARIIAGEFDIVHRLVPLSPTMPSLIAARCRRHGIHFVVGPLNGGLPWPRAFNGARIKEREWLSYVRCFHRLLPFHRSTHMCASAIIVASRDALRQMPRGCRDRCFYIPENAIEPRRFPDVPRSLRAVTSPLRAVFVGRLVPYKGADMLIEASANLLREGKLTLEIVGDGPQGSALRALLDRLRLFDRVKLRGNLDHREVAAVLNQCDVMAFPSIREFGGGVVIEAMAAGAVPIVINYGGPGELVTERTGFLIEPGTREQIVERLSSLLRQLCSTPELVISRSGPARLRARTHFTWEAKAAQVMKVYRWILGQAVDKPVFPMPTPDDIDCR